ncbi:hypothetical protein A2313_00985 [Candidatus Roizmanbacteria bacterium RIFOXYB2_FULL_41_10]|nr:MAG: hypothetical protein A2262_03925 [Candidatus Roizmanbacteria bacterium RIFOXYA2_FULL_41_8]OGK69339.1 MAG: hypothetical protein A2313_00985 [Candidatus Roizmanbacteria bacterium RIFOXYB2_FULL_41_10]OGK75974.1 MAG: hypothetical protein A2459_00680 [Candidatus Roizmanbacteria bacterium RIFOXYC2_FULL_41_10]
MPQAFINGQLVTWGIAQDHRFFGCYFVTIGESHNHTTFVIDPRGIGPWEEFVRQVSWRGTDWAYWGSLAIAVLGTGQFSG